VKVNASFVAATFEGPTILKESEYGVVLFSCTDATCFRVSETLCRSRQKGEKTKEKGGKNNTCSRASETIDSNQRQRKKQQKKRKKRCEEYDYHYLI